MGVNTSRSAFADFIVPNFDTEDFHVRQQAHKAPPAIGYESWPVT